jgi:hypothetical protein
MKGKYLINEVFIILTEIIFISWAFWNLVVYYRNCRL